MSIILKVKQLSTEKTNTSKFGIFSLVLLNSKKMAV